MLHLTCGDEPAGGLQCNSDVRCADANFGHGERLAEQTHRQALLLESAAVGPFDLARHGADFGGAKPSDIMDSKGWFDHTSEFIGGCCGGGGLTRLRSALAKRFLAKMAQRSAFTDRRKHGLPARDGLVPLRRQSGSDQAGAVAAAHR